MPTIVVTSTASLARAGRLALADQLTDLVARVMGKRREVTAVRIDDGVAATWTIGGRPVGAAAHAEITVTAGSNSDRDKAAMVAATHAALAEAFGPLPEATYVVVREIAADAWGYAGITQAARRAGTTPLPSPV